MTRSEAQHITLEELLRFALDKVQNCARLEETTIARLDRIAETMSARAHIPVHRTEATRAAIERGVEALERELGIAGDVPVVPDPSVALQASKGGALHRATRGRR
jgi:hypothetical protein